MHIRNLILTIFTTFAAVQMLAVSLPVYSQELANQDTLIADDSLAVDTIMNNDPEWYVAPMTHDLARAPFRAPAAACPIDSVRTFNVDSVLESVTVYEYGDTTRTMVWTVNPDGTRFGSSRTEEGTNGNITFSATYDWDATAGDWKGVEKTEDLFDENGRQVMHTEMDWVGGAWMLLSRLTWEFDGASNIREYLTYNRDANTNNLVLAQGRYREWNSANRLMYDIQYTAHNGTTWTAGRKTENTYDAAGITVLSKTVYASYSGGEWIASSGSTKEQWEYTNGQKTKYEKQTGSNSGWKNSVKELWEFANSKQTLYEKYTGSNDTWAISTRNIAAYNDEGLQILLENYALKKGVLSGSKKEEYTYYANKKKATAIVYKWTSDTWEVNIKSIWNYDAAGNTIETSRYMFSAGEWEGYGDRVLKTFNGKLEIGSITQSWSKDDKVWVNSMRDTTIYSGAKIAQEASFKWENNDWVGTRRKDYSYNAKGQNDTVKTYTSNGTDWVYYSRTVNTFDTDGTNVMTHSAQWQDDKWVMASMTRVDIKDEVIDGHRQTLNASWKCNEDSIWIGVSKDTTYYSTTGKLILSAKFSGWSNNDWVPSDRSDYKYDDLDRLVVEQRFSRISNQWKGIVRSEYGYDDQGRKNMTANYRIWDATKNTWIGADKTEQIFDADGKIMSSILSFWGTDDWRASTRNSYTYDSSKREIERLVETKSNDEWVNFRKDIHEYKGNVLQKDNVYYWLDNQWKFKSRNETYEDEEDSKLRREVIGSWSDDGELESFEDNNYFYACDPKLAFTIRYENENGVLLESQEVQNGAMPVYGGEKPTKENTAQYTYSFKGWDKAIVAATSDATYVATFDSIVNAYLITFKNGEDVLQSEVVAYGVAPVYTGETPTKQADAQYSYTFAGWDAEPVAVTGDATYSAVFDSIVNTYLVTFKNGEEVLQSEAVAYGVAPVYTGEMPSRPATAEFTYTFVGWDAELAAVTGEATYTATFSSTVNKYLITFKNGDETLQSTEVEYGVAPVYTGEMPSRPATAEYTYTFAGWDAELAAVTGEATYNATFSNTLNKYLITFKNGESILQSTEVEFGSVPAYNGEEPTKPSDAQYSYTFAGWDVKPVAVTGEATYNAVFSQTQIGYTITWLNEDATLIDQTIVAFGTVPEHADATKENTAEFTYTFVGWDKPLSAVTADETYTAQYDSVRNKYTITFLFDDGVTAMETVEVEYGQTPATTITPSKIAEEHYYYHFIGWTPAVVPVTGEATYTAIFDTIPQEYLITFKNYNGTVLQKTNVPYGTMPEYTGATPTKPRTRQYSYEFVGWNPELTEVAGATTYTAQFEAVLNQYTVVFLDEDGTELDRQVVDYGTKPVYQGETPMKAEDEQYTYTFAGWYPAVVTVTKDATYRATYTAHDKSQGLWGVQDGEPSSTKIIRNGTLYILRAGKTYTTDGVMVEQ